MHTNGSAPIEVPVFAKGFAAIEAEFVVQLAKDAPANVTEWTTETARRFVKAMYIGIEIASSPLVKHQRLRPGGRRQRFRQQRRPAARRRNRRLADAQSRIAELRNPHRRRASSAAEAPPPSAAARWPPSPSRCAVTRAVAGRCAPATSSRPAPPPVSTRSRAGQSAEAIFTGVGSLKCITVPMTPVPVR